jgi:hypothetical protein
MIGTNIGSFFSVFPERIDGVKNGVDDNGL